MKKLFISQPMKDKTNEEILAVREEAIASAREELGEDVEVIDSFFEDAPHEANLYGFWANHCNYFLVLMLHILQKVGLDIVVASLKINVHTSMELKSSEANIKKIAIMQVGG